MRNSVCHSEKYRYYEFEFRITFHSLLSSFYSHFLKNLYLVEAIALKFFRPINMLTTPGMKRGVLLYYLPQSELLLDESFLNLLIKRRRPPATSRIVRLERFWNSSRNEKIHAVKSLSFLFPSYFRFISSGNEDIWVK